MRNNMRNYLVIAVVTFLFHVTTEAASNPIDTSLITTHPLQKKDEKHFAREFVRSYMDILKSETFFIMQGGIVKLVGPKQIPEKERWLHDIAKDQFTKYVQSAREDRIAVEILYGGKKVGFMLYHKKPDHTVYIADLVITHPYKQKGIASYVVEKLLPSLNPLSKRYEVFVRHQNGPALWLFANKMGFSVDPKLVERHELNPVDLVGLYKIIP